MENNTSIKTSWDETKEKLLQRFERLSNNDLRLKIEEQDALLLKIQNKLGKTKEEILHLISARQETVIPVV
ncbi:MAG TPA: general stress protein CsbD [Bacteroidia bacterium]|jgi:hypothetical protein